MISGLIAIVELGLVTLLAVLAGRMFRLYRTETFLMAGVAGIDGPASSATPFARAYPISEVTEPQPADRTELFTQLHILAGLQERDCRVQGLVLTESPATVCTYAAAWLYGASCALSAKPDRHSRTLAMMVAGIIKRKTGLRQSDALAAIDELTGSSVLMACYRAGLEGAEHWQLNHFVPIQSSLFEAITANAFI